MVIHDTLRSPVDVNNVFVLCSLLFMSSENAEIISKLCITRFLEPMCLLFSTSYMLKNCGPTYVDKKFEVKNWTLGQISGQKGDMWVFSENYDDLWTRRIMLVNTGQTSMGVRWRWWALLGYWMPFSQHRNKAGLSACETVAAIPYSPATWIYSLWL